MAEPCWLSDEEQRAWRSFLTATRVVFRELDRELQRDAGMPHTYYVILVALSETPGRAMRMTELANVCDSSPSRLSHAVARLEEAGWIRRAQTPDDRRGALATLTDEGFEVLEAAAPGHVASVRQHVFDRLTPQQVAELRGACESILGDRR